MTDIIALKGDADSGKAVFRRTCVNCHKVFNEGFELGPQMNGVATRLKPHEIVESIIDPNAKIDPKFVSTQIITEQGQSYIGLVSEEDAQSVTLKMPGGKVQVVKKSEIDERFTLKQSSMPEALASTLAPLEFVDLLEFLKSLK